MRSINHRDTIQLNLESPIPVVHMQPDGQPQQFHSVTPLYRRETCRCKVTSNTSTSFTTPQAYPYLLTLPSSSRLPIAKCHLRFISILSKPNSRRELGIEQTNLLSFSSSFLRHTCQDTTFKLGKGLEGEYDEPSTARVCLAWTSG